MKCIKIVGCYSGHAISMWRESSFWDLIKLKVQHTNGNIELLFYLLQTLSHENCCKLAMIIWCIW